MVAFAIYHDRASLCDRDRLNGDADETLIPDRVVLPLFERTYFWCNPKASPPKFPWAAFHPTRSLANPRTGLLKAVRLVL
jgi:hypothetical protein